MDINLKSVHKVNKLLSLLTECMLHDEALRLKYEKVKKIRSLQPFKPKKLHVLALVEIIRDILDNIEYYADADDPAFLYELVKYLLRMYDMGCGAVRCIYSWEQKNIIMRRDDGQISEAFDTRTAREISEESESEEQEEDDQG